MAPESCRGMNIETVCYSADPLLGSANKVIAQTCTMSRPGLGIFAGLGRGTVGPRAPCSFHQCVSTFRLILG